MCPDIDVLYFVSWIHHQEISNCLQCKLLLFFSPKEHASVIGRMSNRTLLLSSGNLLIASCYLQKSVSRENMKSESTGAFEDSLVSYLWTVHGWLGGFSLPREFLSSGEESLRHSYLHWEKNTWRSICEIWSLSAKINLRVLFHNIILVYIERKYKKIKDICLVSTNNMYSPVLK